MSQRLALVRASRQLLQLRALRVDAATKSRALSSPSSSTASSIAAASQWLQGPPARAASRSTSVAPLGMGMGGSDGSSPAAAAFLCVTTGTGKRRGMSTLWSGTPVLRESAKKDKGGNGDKAPSQAAAEEPSPTPPAAAADDDEAPNPAQSPYEAEKAAASSGPDDPVPDYQNPRHHNSPDHQRVFHDEFGDDEPLPPDVPMPPFDDGSGKVLASPELHAVADSIVNMTMVEVNELCNRIGEHFGIEEDDGAGGMAAEGDEEEGGGDAKDEVKEVRTTFDLKLVAFDAKAKIKVIKEVRTMAGLGLKEAKETVEGVPKVVMKDIKKEEAEELKAKLEALGATVEIV